MPPLAAGGCHLMVLTRLWDAVLIGSIADSRRQSRQNVCLPAFPENRLVLHAIAWFLTSALHPRFSAAWACPSKIENSQASLASKTRDMERNRELWVAPAWVRDITPLRSNIRLNARTRSSSHPARSGSRAPASPSRLWTSA